MSWSVDSDDQSVVNRGDNEKWKMQSKKIEQLSNSIQTSMKTVADKDALVRVNRADPKDINKDIESINKLFDDLRKEISVLESYQASYKNQELMARKLDINKINQRAQDLIKKHLQFCNTFAAYINRRSMEKKKEISMIHSSLDNDGNNMNQYQEQMSMDDPQLQEAIEEQRQMAKLQQDTIMLEDMFLKVNTMIHEQGEIVNRIEENVEEAHVKVEEGEKELVKAVTYKTSALKKKLCIIGIVLVILIVIGLIIGLSVGLSKR